MLFHVKWLTPTEARVYATLRVKFKNGTFKPLEAESYLPFMSRSHFRKVLHNLERKGWVERISRSLYKVLEVDWDSIARGSRIEAIIEALSLCGVLTGPLAAQFYLDHVIKGDHVIISASGEGAKKRLINMLGNLTLERRDGSRIKFEFMDIKPVSVRSIRVSHHTIRIADLESIRKSLDKIGGYEKISNALEPDKAVFGRLIPERIFFEYFI